LGKIVVIGGVAAGASAAVKARRVDETAEIVIFERGAYVSWANCGLPYYVGGEIKEQESLVLVNEQAFDRRFNIKVRCLHEVQNIDRDNKLVRGINLSTGEAFEENYDKLVLAPGCRPIRPNLPGIDLAGIFTITTIPEAKRLRSFIETRTIRKAVVIGGGFIGLECLEALLNRGIKTLLVEGTEHVLPPFDPEMVTDVHKYLARRGVTLCLGAMVSGFSGTTAVQRVQLSSGESLEADLVVLSIGVIPETKLAVEAGLDIGETRGIVVSERMQSSDPDIFAAGDAVETVHWVTGKKTRIALAGPANKQGRVAGANAAGGNMLYTGAAGSSIVKIGVMAAGKTGISEQEAINEGLSHFCSYVHPANHAGYYPGGTGMTIKLVVENKSGRLLGAQVVGHQGVDKRIDGFAAAIYAKLSVNALEDFDLSYAPPFSSAKDPVILAGFVASNILRGEVQAITPRELDARLQSGDELVVVDVRTKEEFAQAHIPGAISLPLESLRKYYLELNPEKEIVLNCRVGYRSYLAYKILEGNGFKNLKNLSGGFLSWVQWIER